MNDYKLEHMCSYTGRLINPPEVIGPVPEGIRVNFYSAGGEFTGLNMRGNVRSVGGDWVTVRKDGVAHLDVRSTFEAHDGALILVTYQGVADFGEDGYDRFLRGEVPSVVKLRTAPRFVTSHAEYAWLNRLSCLGIGEYRSVSNEATYDVYAVR
ncbi:MAG: DUF3237 domain-containing protein [Nitrospira sp.]